MADVGSNWARGASGVAVEFHGTYDGSYFANATELDYCSPSGFSWTSQVTQMMDWCQPVQVTFDHGGHDPGVDGITDSTMRRPGSSR